MTSAVAFALVAMISWGVWAVLADAATESVAPTLAVVISYGASTLLALGYVGVNGDALAFDSRGVGLALMSGVASGVGVIAFYAGLEQDRAGLVTTLSALYFVVAVVLGIVFLGESFTLRDLAGVACAVVAVALLAG